MKKEKNLNPKKVFKFDIDTYFLYYWCELMSNFGVIEDNESLKIAYFNFKDELQKLIGPDEKEIDFNKYELTSMYGILQYDKIF